MVDLGYGRKVRDQGMAQLLEGGIQTGLNRRLNGRECRWGGMGRHVAAR
jgi:hypothetical protein